VEPAGANVGRPVTREGRGGVFQSWKPPAEDFGEWAADSFGERPRTKIACAKSGRNAKMTASRPIDPERFRQVRP
jgi:hypothetical protein